MKEHKLKHHHHVTPKVYLRGFTDDRAKVTVRDRSGAERDLHIGNVAVRRNFYNFRAADGTHIGLIEDWLDHHVESNVGPLLKRLRAGQSVLSDDVPTLALFVAAQAFRSATTASYMHQIDTHLGPRMLAHAVESELRRKHPLDWERHRGAVARAAQHAWANRPADSVRRSHLRTMLREMDSQAARLARVHWQVLTSQEPLLISGDAPVATAHTAQRWSGLLPLRAPVFLPLTPYQLLVAEPTTLSSGGRLSGELARTVNHAISRQTDVSIINAPWHGWPDGVILAAHRPTLPAPRVRRVSRTPQTPLQTFPPVLSPQIQDLLDALDEPLDEES